MKFIKILLPILLSVACKKEESGTNFDSGISFKCRDIANNMSYDNCSIEMKDEENKEFITADIKFLTNLSEISSIELSNIFKQEYQREQTKILDESTDMTLNEKYHAQKMFDLYLELISSCLKNYKLTLNGYTTDHKINVDNHILKLLEDTQSVYYGMLQISPSGKNQNIQERIRVSHLIIDNARATHSMTIENFLNFLINRNVYDLSDKVNEINNAKLKIEKNKDGQIYVTYYKDYRTVTDVYSFKLNNNNERIYTISKLNNNNEHINTISK